MTGEELAQELKLKHADIFDIDSNLDRLVRKIELLSYVNPLNIEKEKQKFFASKYTQNPEFKYPKLKFDPYKLHRLFFSQRLERIKDDRIHQLYKDIIYHYANMVQCIRTIGKGREFYYNSLRVYGTPTEKDVQNALFILHYEDETPTPDMEKVFSAEEAQAYFEHHATEYDFPFKVLMANNISAEAMVSNTKQALLLKRHTTFSKNQLLTLANHEIGVHLVTTFNGLHQPLKIFSHGFPNNVETQEGLSVLSEYVSGALTLTRLKELSYRVLASDSLIKGYSFADTFDLIHGTYKLNRHKAFNITLRAHRGGGFTKDRLYLSGLGKLFHRYQKGESLDILFAGKVATEYEDAIKYLQSTGLAVENKHRNKAFDGAPRSSKKLEFILSHLK